MKIKKSIKLILWIIACIPLFLIGYLIFALIFSFIPINTDFQEDKNGIEIFVKSNGVHTDIVLPVKTIDIDWRSKINPKDFRENKNIAKYIGFGWGDKGFYLYTPRWKDLKISTALEAMFWMGTSAMHVSYYDYIPLENSKTKKIKISPQQYDAIIAHIDRSFQKDEKGKYKLIGCCHYDGVNDNFYEANGTYNLFFTCNTWANKCLKEGEITTSLWTPFEWPLIRHLSNL